jgi:hypothetical protein
MEREQHNLLETLMQRDRSITRYNLGLDEAQLTQLTEYISRDRELLIREVRNVRAGDITRINRLLEIIIISSKW